LLQKRAVFERILDQRVSPKLSFRSFIQNAIINVGFFMRKSQILRS
jgi:hypothetical protein